MNDFASAKLTAGQLNAIVKKLGGHEGAIRFLQGKTSVVEPERKWREKDEIIYFSVKSDGTTGREWIERLEKNGYIISDDAVGILCSDDFRPSSGVTTEIVVLRNEMWDGENKLHFVPSPAEAHIKPSAEVACLIREAISDEDLILMGLWHITIMHEEIQPRDFPGRSLSIFRSNSGSGLSAATHLPRTNNTGRAYEISRVSSS